MTKEKCAQIIGVCEEIAKTADDLQITEQINHTKQMINTAHTPTLALAGIGPVGYSLLNVASKICEMEMPAAIKGVFANGSSCLTIEHSESERLYRVTSDGNFPITDCTTKPNEIVDVDELVYASPCEKLKEKKIILCGNIVKHDDWISLFENIDIVVLRINATAVMNQTERNWLDNELIPLFGKSHCAIWIDLMDQLNTETDQEDVMSLVKNTLRKRNLEIPIFTFSGAVKEWMLNELAKIDVYEQYRYKMMKICLNILSSRIMEIQNIKTIDEQSLKAVILKIESQRNNLELAGRIAAETTVVNTYEKLKIDAKAGIHDFNTQAIDNICQKVKDISIEELEDLEPNIQKYLRKVWEQYQQEMNVKLHAATEKCYEELMTQMEEDAARFISDMDEETQNLLEEAINRSVTSKDGNLVRPDWEYQGTNSLTKLKIETRNMMMLSIPLVFVSPVLAVATFFGAKYYKKTQSEKRGNEFRESLMMQIRSSCDAVVQDICDEVDRNFDEVALKTADEVKQAYCNLVDKLIEQINELIAEQKALNTRIETLKSMQTVTIPSLMCVFK